MSLVVRRVGRRLSGRKRGRSVRACILFFFAGAGAAASRLGRGRRVSWGVS